MSVNGHCSTNLMFYIFTIISSQQVAIVLVWFLNYDGGDWFGRYVIHFCNYLSICVYLLLFICIYVILFTYCLHICLSICLFICHLFFIYIYLSLFSLLITLYTLLYTYLSRFFFPFHHL
jgi:hypothetical protein